MDHGYTGDEYKDLINNIFKFRLKDGDSSFTEFNIQKPGLKNNFNNHLEKHVIHVDDDCLISRNPLKIFNIDNRTHSIINHKSKTETKYEDKKNSS